MKEIVVPYQTIRHMMKSGDVILWRSENPIGWLIRKFSNADVNHASTVIRTEELGSDRVLITEALSRGIEVHALSERLKNHKGTAYWIKLLTQYDKARYGIRKWAMDRIDTGYDYSSLFKQIRQRVKLNSKELFCSEFSFMAWQIGGRIEKLEEVTIAPRPGDLESFRITYGRMRIK